MAKISVVELAHVRLRAPDLALSRQFTESFGLQTVDHDGRTVQSRATDAGPRCHIVEAGPPTFLGSGFLVGSGETLAAAASIEGAGSVEPVDGPGGGHRVLLSDPDGFTVELLHGIEVLPEIPVDHHPVNSAAGRMRRDGEFYRRPPGPSRVKRLGHFVTSTPEVKRSQAWYRETLGLIGTDDVYAGADDNIIATFNRLAKGQDFVDHHVFMTHYAPQTDLNHLGFEVQDYDDIFFGHYFMKEAGLEHRWGIGRHRLGSQVYNQWTDPWGRGYEHWTDTDVVNEDRPLSLVPASEALKSQWGDPPPAQLARPLD